MVEKKTQVSEVLMDGVYSEKSPLFLLRGQIWEQVVLPRIMTELEFYWRKLAKQGRTPEEAARYHMKRNGEPHHSIVNLLPPPPQAALSQYCHRAMGHPELANLVQTEEGLSVETFTEKFWIYMI